MNITDMTHDDATQLPLFASLPPLATLCFGVSCLLLSLLLILLTVRHHTKRYLLPVSSLQSALSSNRVTHCNAEIKSCSAHDPFLNLSFATTHLRRKVHTYGFIKSTYREFYLFNKRATNAEKSLMATKEGNGDSRSLDDEEEQHHQLQNQHSAKKLKIPKKTAKAVVNMLLLRPSNSTTLNLPLLLSSPTIPHHNNRANTEYRIV
ncbi:hypothetical protein TL16_g03181 [Triparma laevis f. inornata]|uniref:Uncharacterized protein n=1 Tax=Triparma laevis f. inornata TaxID=1714386 RepID=A0A9W6ZWK6_9STRA|nr:hypothetical protein TL16_g03181 [Triparma laevis f. inornata]